MTDVLTASAPTTLPSAPAARPSSWGRRLVLRTGYCASALPLAVIGFVVAVAGTSLGLTTFVLVVGPPVLAATASLARGLAHVERARQRALLERPAPSPAYGAAAPGATWWTRVLTVLRDPQAWLDVLWGFVGFVTGLAAFVVVVTWWAVAVGGLTYWFWQRWLPIDGDDTLAAMIGFGEGRTPEIWLMLAIGTAALLLVPAVVRLMTAVHGGTARALLCGRAELQERVRHAEGGREAARRAETSSLRRLERDIHDGPQQRLVRVMMDLGRARQQLGTDPATVRTTLDGALDQTRDAVEELRSLSRGIAPPVLVDRGLAAALQECFARCPVPVHADVRVPDDLAPHAASTVYFVVAEALTNVVKHADASRVDVTVAATDAGRVRVAVVDDGVGGADAGAGHGLAGLAERVRGADGVLTVDSPPGGPTRVAAELAG